MEAFIDILEQLMEKLDDELVNPETSAEEARLIARQYQLMVFLQRVTKERLAFQTRVKQ